MIFCRVGLRFFCDGKTSGGKSSLTRFCPETRCNHFARPVIRRAASPKFHDPRPKASGREFTRSGSQTGQLAYNHDSGFCWVGPALGTVPSNVTARGSLV